MRITQRSPRFIIEAALGAVTECPSESFDAYVLRITKTKCSITSRTADGLRRAIVFLEDEMIRNQAPFLRTGEYAGYTFIEDRITRSPVAPYRWLTGWELQDSNNYYPDEYLNKLMHCGINGIWVAGLLRNHIHSDILPELGPSAHKLTVLKKLVTRAAQYGIKVFFFGCEARALHENHPLFKRLPEVRGARISWEPTYALCTSSSVVRDYIRDSVRTLFTEIPQLGGFINIFCGERPTHCWINEKTVTGCKICSARAQHEVIAENLNCFAEGIRLSGSKGKLIAWTYALDGLSEDNKPKPVNTLVKVIQHTDPSVVWMGNFEHGSIKKMCGKQVGVNEYSLSVPGPSKAFSDIAQTALENKRRVYAKLQMGNSYEMSSVPYLPLPGIPYNKISACTELGVSGSMMSWIIGGWPGIMLKAAGASAFITKCVHHTENCKNSSKKTFLHTLSRHYGNEETAKILVKSWDIFEKAFSFYPCVNPVLYFSPITRCPAYWLHLEKEQNHALPYNWGYTRERFFQPFEDDPVRWCGVLSPWDIIRSFQKISALWDKGLEFLKSISETRNPGAYLNKEVSETYAVAEAAGIQFKSAALVIEFYLQRSALISKNGEIQKTTAARLAEIITLDILLAEQMIVLQKKHPAIGFESEIYEYSYSPALLREKIRHDKKTLEKLNNKTKLRAALSKTMPDTRAGKVQVYHRNTNWRTYINAGD